MISSASRCIFVGNIPYDYDDQSLIETLSMVGPINNFRIVFDEVTGKSKGYGFCEYRDSETAASALRNLKSIDYNGRQLRINVAENDKTGINLTEDMIRAAKDISYIKQIKANENKFYDLLKNLTDEQKLIMFHTIKCMNDKDPINFKNLMLNQTETLLTSIKEVQAEFINKFNVKQKSTINKII